MGGGHFERSSWTSRWVRSRRPCMGTFLEPVVFVASQSPGRGRHQQGFSNCHHPNIVRILYRPVAPLQRGRRPAEPVSVLVSGLLSTG